jgi:large subunit ribosomal protein L9
MQQRAGMRKFASFTVARNTQHMKVILLRDVAGIGPRGSVKDVADGYALNFLMPNKMAKLATPEALKDLDRKIAEESLRREAQEKEWVVTAEKLKKFTLMLRANAGKEGHLYKKISAADIGRVLREQGIDVPEEAIVPKMPIKQIGSWPVEIEFGTHKATITVDVIAA